MEKRTVLFVKGIADNRTTAISHIDRDGRHFFQYSGSANLNAYLADTPFNKLSLTLDTNRSQEIRLPKIDAIFNQISDADTHRTALAKVEGLYNTLPEKVPLFNAPAEIRKTTRDSICRVLQGIEGLHVPKTAKITPKSPSDIFDAIGKGGFSFPVIFRQAGDHGGVSTLLVRDGTEAFHAFALDGREYYLTQFTDTADAKGIYSKYRLVVVDGRLFIRHAIFSDRWIIHSRSRDFMEKEKAFQSKEAEILKTFEKTLAPRLLPVVTEIRRRIGLDYFGIDCHIGSDFSLTLFELNANMNVLLNTSQGTDNIWAPGIRRIADAITAMIAKRVS